MSVYTVSSDAPHAVDRENPWPGLAPFEEGDVEFFKGRDADVAEIVRLVLRQDLTFLWGLSGLGKTSLLRAGVFPQLRAVDVFPVYIRLRYADDDEGEQAQRLVEQCLEAINAAARLWDYEVPAEPSGPLSLWRYARRREHRFWGPGGRLVTPLLVFDQFEEIFAKTRSEAAWKEIEAFFRDLADTISGAPPEWLVQCDGEPGETSEGAEPSASEHADEYLFGPGVFKAMLSFREDFLGRIARLTPLVRGVDHSSYRLQAMTFDQAIDVVAKAGGHLLAGNSADEKQQLCRQIVSRVSDAPSAVSQTEATVDPGLLSLYCRELNEKRRARAIREGKHEIDSDLLAGSEALRIISDFYENSMAEVSAATRTFVEERLVLRESRSRDSVPRELALAAGASEKELDLLIEKRILRPDEMVRGGRRIVRLELTHDVLIEPALAAFTQRKLVEETVAAERQQREAAEREREAALKAQREAEQAAHERELKLAFFHERAKSQRRKRLVAILATLIVVLGMAYLRNRSEGKARDVQVAIERAYDDSAAGRFAEALGRLAWLLPQRPDDHALRSLAFDLLLRRVWLVPVTIMGPEPPAPTSRLSLFSRPVLAAAADDRYVRFEFNGRGNLIAAVTTTGAVHVRKTDTGDPVGKPLPAGAASLDVAFTNDDVSIVTASGAGRVALWNATTGDLLAELAAPAPLAAVALQSFTQVSGNAALRIATWSGDRFVRLWTVEGSTARESGRLPADVPDSCSGAEPAVDIYSPADGSNTCLAFTRDGSRLLTVSGPEVTIWDVRTARRYWIVQHDGPVVSAAFDAYGGLMTATRTGVRLWDVDRKRSTAAASVADLTRAAYDPQGTQIVTLSASEDETTRNLARIWNVGYQASRIELRTSVSSPQAFVMAALPRDEVFATLVRGGAIRLSDASSGAALSAPIQMNARSMRLHPSSGRLAVLDGDGTIAVSFVRVPAQPAQLQLGGPAVATQFSSDARQLLAASLDGTARIWNLDTRFEIQLFHGTPVLSAEYSMDGARVLTSTGSHAFVWDARTGERLVDIAAPNQDDFSAVRFNRAGTRILTVSEGDNPVRVWDAQTGQLVRELSDARRIWYAEFNPAGDRVVTASQDGKADVWDAETGRHVGGPFEHDAEVVGARFSPDGTRVVTASNDGTAKVWAVDGRSAPITLPHLAGVTSARFANDATRVVTTSHDWTARMWTLGPAVRSLTVTHEGPVDASELDLQHSRVLTISSRAGEIRVWDLESGKATSRALTAGTPIWSAQFSPDGDSIAAAADDGFVRIYMVPAGTAADAEWVATLASAVGGLVVDDSGGNLVAAADRGRQLAALRAEAAAAKGSDLRSRFLRWFFLDQPF